MNDTFTFNIIINNSIVSYCRFKRYQRDDISYKEGIFLIDLYTSERYRNKGFATQLLNRLVSYCKENNLAYILLDDCTDCKPPKNLYYKLGFSICTNSEDKWEIWKDTDYEDYDEERVLFLQM